MRLMARIWPRVAVLAVAGYLALHGYRLAPRERSLHLPKQQLQGVTL